MPQRGEQQEEQTTSHTADSRKFPREYGLKEKEANSVSHRASAHANLIVAYKQDRRKWWYWWWALFLSGFHSQLNGFFHDDSLERQVFLRWRPSNLFQLHSALRTPPYFTNLQHKLKKLNVAIVELPQMSKNRNSYPITVLSLGELVGLDCFELSRGSCDRGITDTTSGMIFCRMVANLINVSSDWRQHRSVNHVILENHCRIYWAVVQKSWPSWEVVHFHDLGGRKRVVSSRFAENS